MKMTGTVVRGKQLGRTIGFPTANIRPDKPGARFGENGVYIAWIRVETYPKRMRCMLNQGSHPTAPEGAPTIEAHILDFYDDIYGLRVEIEPLAFTRPETRFPTLDALKVRLARDLEETRAYFAASADQV